MAQDFSNETSYYQKKFQAFEENKGQWKSTWNWPAFFFSGFWYLYKGMWGKALILFSLAIILTVFLPTVTTPLIPLWAAVLGNYDYYLFKKYGDQWKFWAVEV